MDIQLSQAWIALAATIIGGSGFKVVEHWLGKTEKQDDTASKLRDELRKEVISLRDELRKVETELDIWRGKYWELREQFLKVQSDLDVALKAIRST
jgi:predicted  nucleic acid-binding Zn-ribbon protein